MGTHEEQGQREVSRRVVSVGFVSTALPTPCGIATFTTALATALVRDGVTCSVVRVLDTPEPAPATSAVPIVATLVATDRSTIASAARALNRRDVAVIQHEYGLYGGADGEDVLDVMAGVRVPIIAILHTVLPHPTDHQRWVLNEVVRRSDQVVVMSRSARATLSEVYEIGTTPVSVIAHGAMVMPATTPTRGARPLILTWGLIGPGKGIEWAIDAVATLRDLVPRPRYVVAGRTHPKVLATSGDAYRRSLERRVRERHAGSMVEFDNSYRSLDSLEQLIASADVVILPYDSREQATSGVLVDAIAAGRPVVATAFPHAVELLSSGAGLVVDQGDVAAMAFALRRILTEPVTAAAMRAEAARIAPTLSWDAVALRYRGLIDSLVDREVAHVS
ncbi:MAG: glycosyltransferase [Acidimicrobiales bacterium]